MLAETFSLQYFQTNNISVQAAVAGTGPLVIMVHGWPELWYSWRHQILPIAEAGYKVVVPNVRGYGGSDKPYPVEAYDMIELTADIVGLIDALGEEKAILIGHDWGSPICWNTAALHPERVAAVIGLSVPYLQRGEISITELWKKMYQGKFFYQLYFQAEGVAETELEADVRTALRKIYYCVSGEAIAKHSSTISTKSPDAKFLDGLLDPQPFPDWLTETDLDYFVEAFTQSGFRGSINRYRAQHRDWELLPQLATLTVNQPSCFIAGALDVVRHFIPGMDLFANPGAHCTDFRGTTLIEGKGHWIQQEAPQLVNRVILDFLAEIA